MIGSFRSSSAPLRLPPSGRTRRWGGHTVESGPPRADLFRRRACHRGDRCHGVILIFEMMSPGRRSGNPAAKRDSFALPVPRGQQGRDRHAWNVSSEAPAENAAPRSHPSLDDPRHVRRSRLNPARAGGSGGDIALRKQGLPREDPRSLGCSDERNAHVNGGRGLLVLVAPRFRGTPFAFLLKRGHFSRNVRDCWDGVAATGRCFSAPVCLESGELLRARRRCCTRRYRKRWCHPAGFDRQSHSSGG